MCAIIPHEEWSAHLPYLGREPAGGWTTEVCDAWPVTLPSQPQSITAPWPVPNYTAWWQRHMCVNSLPNVVTWKQIAAESNPRPFESRVHRHNHYTNFNPPPKKKQKLPSRTYAPRSSLIPNITLNPGTHSVLNNLALTLFVCLLYSSIHLQNERHNFTTSNTDFNNFNKPNPWPYISKP